MVFWIVSEMVKDRLSGISRIWPSFSIPSSSGSWPRTRRLDLLSF